MGPARAVIRPSKCAICEQSHVEPESGRPCASILTYPPFLWLPDLGAATSADESYLPAEPGEAGVQFPGAQEAG